MAIPISVKEEEDNKIGLFNSIVFVILFLQPKKLARGNLCTLPN